jgi:hypothetical protein
MKGRKHMIKKNEALPENLLKKLSVLGWKIKCTMHKDYAEFTFQYKFKKPVPKFSLEVAIREDTTQRDIVRLLAMQLDFILDCSLYAE